MRLLIITQKVDKKDPVLGVFHRWLEEFAKNFEVAGIICLEKGEYNLPVPIYALGKGKLKILWKLYKYIFSIDYDTVFVHMNQEYVLVAGLIWRLMGKKVYLWRNHAKGNILTNIAVWLSHKVFYTSPESYTARFKKAVRMPVGVDTDFFKPDSNVTRERGTILFLGRISPVKKVLEFIDWAKNINYQVTIAGPILAEDKEYGEEVKLKIKNSKLKINFLGPVTQEGARRLYQTHEIYANFTPAGSYDKTIFEAVACGARLEVRNPDTQNLKVEEHSLRALIDKLKREV